MQPAENHKAAPALGLITPLTASVFHRLPAGPAVIGISSAMILILMFLLSRHFLGDSNASSGDFRLALIHILLTAFVPSAYVYLLSVTKEVATEMEPTFGREPENLVILNNIGKHTWWWLLIAALAGILVNIYATTVTTIGSDPWLWQAQNHDAKWMRILGPMFCGWMACLFYVIVIESSRLSSLSKSIGSIDLLDLRPYKPLLRQGLTNVLVVVGILSIVSLFLFEPGFVTLLIQLSILFAIVAWVGLMLPLSGIRRKIKMAKQQELNWCTRALQNARNQMKFGEENQSSMTEVIAYQDLIESIRNWPFDSPTLARFALYLLIPIGSTFGGAFVERWLDVFIP